jgi:hypothetical protein
MSTAQLIIVCITVLLLAVVLSRGAGAKAEPLVTEGRVSLSLEDGQTVDGFVVPGPEGFASLVGATLHTPGAKPTSMGGVQRLRESSITLVQELDAQAPVAERDGAPA